MKVDNKTIARTVIMFLALINQILAMFGKGTIDLADSDLYQLFSIAATVITTTLAWWKNNSFTAPALEADDYLRVAKHRQGVGRVDTEEIK